MVANRFLDPVIRAGGSALIVPSMPSVVDASQIALRCDALLMTGSCSNVGAHLYGGVQSGMVDSGRDEVAMAVADAMIEAGRPVLGICRGMQELNTLFGGSLRDLDGESHMAHLPWDDPLLLAHAHDIGLVEGGRLSASSSEKVVSIFSAHTQGVDRLGSGLEIEALASDGLVEAFSANVRAQVFGVQWHPEVGSSHLDQRLFADLVRAA